MMRGRGSARCPLVPVSLSFLAASLCALGIVGCSSSGDGDEGAPERPAFDPAARIVVETGPGGQASPTEAAVAADGTASIALVPDDGFRTADVRGCSGTLDGDRYEMRRPRAGCRVFATFERIAPALVIDVFGEGRVLAADGRALCGARETCETDLEADGRATVLDAEAGAGWELSHWLGCDSVSGSECTAVLDRPRAVFPTFVRASAPELADAVVVLSADLLEALLATTPDALVFAADVPGRESLVPGAILVSTEGRGFARRVVSVDGTSGEPLTLLTDDADPVDVIERGTLVFRPDEDGPPPVFVPAPGVEVDRSGRRSVTGNRMLSIVLGKLKAVLTQSFEIDPELHLDINFSGLVEHRVYMDGFVTAKLEVTVEEALEWPGADRGNGRQRLGTLYFRPITAGPVVLTPEVDFFVELKARAAGALVFEISAKAEGRYGMSYRRGEGWSRISELDASDSGTVAEDTDLRLELSASAWTAADLRLLIYGAAGVGSAFGPKLELKNTLATDCQAGIARERSLGFRATLGSRSNGLWFFPALNLLELERTVAVRRTEDPFDGDIPCRPPPTVPTPPPPEVVETPDRSLSVDVVPDADGDPCGSWALYRDDELFDTATCGSIVAEPSGSPGADCWSTSTIGADGVPSPRGEERCIEPSSAPEVAPPPPPVDTPSLVMGSTSATVSWDPVRASTPDTSYLVVVDDERTIRTPTTSVAIEHLRPSTTYCFVVHAVDVAGRRSEAGASSCGATDSGAADLWRVRIGCVGSPGYTLSDTVVLDTARAATLTHAGSGFDNDGVTINWILAGAYDPGSAAFDGQVTYLFENVPDRRADTFVASLATPDSGDVVMATDADFGCETRIRFDRAGGTSAVAAGGTRSRMGAPTIGGGTNAP